MGLVGSVGLVGPVGPTPGSLPRESVPAVVDVLEARTGAPGLQFLDRHGETVPW